MTSWEEGNILKFENVSKTFKDGVTAVDNVSFYVKEHEFLTILGPSGSGKTTMLRMIAGFEFPTNGEIYLNKKPLTNVPSNKRPVNTVFQNYALFPHMDVHNNIVFGLKAKKVPMVEIEKRFKEIIDLISLTGLEKRYPNQLSGGQQQRVALARALICKPEIVLSDESLGALDLKLRRQTQIALRQINKDTNITFVHVTHDQEEAFMLSDRIIVVENGKIEQIGSPIELYSKPKSLFVGGFIGENNLLKIKIEEIKNDSIIGKTSRNDEVVLLKNSLIPKEIKIGEIFLLLIRPESVKIGDAKDKFQNQLSVETLGTFLSGSELKIMLKYSETENLMLKLKTGAGNINRAKNGEKINVYFNSDEINGLFKENNC